MSDEPENVRLPKGLVGEILEPHSDDETPASQFYDKIETLIDAVQRVRSPLQGSYDLSFTDTFHKDCEISSSRMMGIEAIKLSYSTLISPDEMLGNKISITGTKTPIGGGGFHFEVLEHDLDENGFVKGETFDALVADVAEKLDLDLVKLQAAIKDGQTIDATAAPVPQALGTPAAEIMHAEEHTGGLSHAEDDLYDKMENIANSIMFAALNARIPMHMAPIFTYGQRDGQNTGGFAVQVPKQGHDTNLITYTTNIDERRKTITITPKEQSQFTMVNDQNETAEVIENHSDNQIVAALGADGLVTDETLHLFIEDVAEKMGISADLVWQKMIEAREMDGEIIGFEHDPDDDGFRL